MELVLQAIALSREIEELPKPQLEKQRSKAWDALWQALPAIRGDTALLHGHKLLDMQLLLERVVERGTKRTVLKSRAKAIIQQLLGSSTWLAAAQASPATLEVLQDFAQVFPMLLERLAASPSPEDTHQATGALFIPAADDTNDHAADDTNEHAADDTNEHAADDTNEHAADDTNEHAADDTNEHAADDTNEHAAGDTNEHAADDTNDPISQVCGTMTGCCMQKSSVPLFLGPEQGTGCSNSVSYGPNFMKHVVGCEVGSQPADMWPAIVQAGQSAAARQIQAIKLYSGNSVYLQMNKALREDDAQGLQHYGGLVRLTMSPFGMKAMESTGVLQPFIGTVWRGCTLGEKQSNYQEGVVVAWEGFSSTSTQPGSSFCGDTKFEIHCNKTLSALKDEHARKTRGIDNSTADEELFLPAQIHQYSDFPNENEVLYPPYTCFRVVQRVEGNAVKVVLETMEFPSLVSLVEEGRWSEVSEAVKAQRQAAKPEVAGGLGTIPWFLQSNSLGADGTSLVEKIAQKIAQEGAGSQGLQVFSEVVGMGADLGIVGDEVPGVLHAVGILEEHSLDKDVPAPSSHGAWYFDAAKINSDDQWRPGWIIQEEDGTIKQRLCPRAAMMLEKWWRDGCQGTACFTVTNNIRKEITYEATGQKHGHMEQRPKPGQGMIGNARRLWRTDSL